MNIATGDYSHAEGTDTYARGNCSHAEGQGNTAGGDASHVEGTTCIAEGASSHAEGQYTKALGHSSHSEGQGTIAHGFGQHVQGKNNIQDTLTFTGTPNTFYANAFDGCTNLTTINVPWAEGAVIVAEMLMTSIGSDGGKFDTDYLSAREELDNIIKDVFNLGTLYLGVFCDWQIDLELVQATRFRVRKLKMTPKMFDEVKEMPYNKLVETYGKSKAKKIQEIIDLEPIELNEAILLFDGGKLERGGVPESGDEHINDKKHRTKTFLKCFFTGLLAINILLTFTTDISIARIIYTVFKLVLLLFRMFKGYERGSRAFNRIEVKHLKARTHYLRNYIQFVNDKVYVKLADKYEEIRDLMAENEVENAEAETA